MPRCFLFKPDGIGDFFLSSGIVRLMAREYGEENLTITVLPIMEQVVRAQFPGATVISLPLRRQRILLNLFVANCLRCFPSWIRLLGTKADVSISLRHMRDYLMSVLFFSVRSKKCLIVSNELLGNGRRVRRWTEAVFCWLFSPTVIAYPEARQGVPRELEANRLLASAALGRDVDTSEVWPELKPIGKPPLDHPYWVCAPFSSSPGKDYPLERWADLFDSLQQKGILNRLILTGSKDQKPQLERFLQLLQGISPSFHSIPCLLLPDTLQDFIDLLAGASWVMTVDTAAAHAAAALDRNTLILFSGQHSGTYAPWVRSSRQHWMMPDPTRKEVPWYSHHETPELVDLVEQSLS